MLVTIDVCYEKIKEIIKETDVYKTVVVSAKDSMPKLMGLGYEVTQGYKVKKPRKSEQYLYWKDFLNKANFYNADYKVEKKIEKEEQKQVSLKDIDDKMMTIDDFLDDFDV